MTPVADALARLLLASARRRSALARATGMGETELLAAEHLACAGRLTPSMLADRLGLTSGGATALVQRLERAGHVARERHPSDRRSRILRPGRRAADRPPLVAADVDTLVAGLDDDARATLTAFLVAWAATRRSAASIPT